MIKYLKNKVDLIKGKLKVLKLKSEGDENKQWYGSEYGGFFVKEKVLKGKEQIVVYSCGVGKDISFDLEILKRYNQSKVYAFDPTPISINWIKGQNLPENFNFYPFGISNKIASEKMFFPKDYTVSYGIFNWDKQNTDEIMVEMQTIEEIATKNNHKFIDILKMDIEGSEFAVLNSIDFSRIQFGQILVEFHERFLENGSQILKQTIENLERNGYKCFAISDDFEYSFVNKRL
jgi:FkbM family methyltransferase